MYMFSVAPLKLVEKKCWSELQLYALEQGYHGGKNCF